MRRLFRSPRQIVELDTYGSEPVGAAGAGMLERYSQGQLDGGRLGGLPHVFMKGNPAVSFTGLVASPQSFQGQAQLGSIENPPVQEYPALPAGHAPPAVTQWLQDWTELEGLTPT